MIKDADAEFHEPDSPHPDWAETNYFGFYLPELKMNCGVYALFRTPLGVVNTNVSMNRHRVTAPWEADYWDAQVHVPIPTEARLTDYELSNGLRVKCHEPNRVWQVDYDDGLGTEMHFEYRAIMDPFDIHDPDHDPMVAAKAAGSDFAWGTAYSGHFDQSGHYEGEVVLDGERHSFSCLSTMDHSWGLRPERQLTTMSWLHAHTDDMAIHAIFDFDPDVTPSGTSQLRLTHGYVATDGGFVGLKAGEGQSIRENLFPVETTLRVVDGNDRTWDLRGTAATTFPWQAWPDVVGFNVLHSWEIGSQPAMGEVMDFMGMSQINTAFARSR